MRLSDAVRGHIDSLRLHRNDGRFVPMPSARPILARAKYQLLPAWSDYVAEVSTVDWAVSLETASYLLWLIRRLKPTSLLDTGSGFSSYVFRRYQREEQESRVAVVSVDDSPEWLEATRTFLKNHQLSTDGVMSVVEFERLTDASFDFVFHDIASKELRVAMLPALLATARPEAPIVVDDGQSQQVREGVRDAVRGTDRRYYSLRLYTLDEIERFALLLSPRAAAPPGAAMMVKQPPSRHEQR